MFLALHLLTTVCAGFPVISEPEWNLQPETFVAPAAPKPELALMRSDTIRFARYYESDSTSDTSFFGWNAAGKSLVEEHAYSAPQVFLENTASRVVLRDVDLDANRKGLALASSEEQWFLQEGVWTKRAEMSKRDSSGVEVYELRTRTFFDDGWVDRRIREKRHASGFVAWRDTSVLRDSVWETTALSQIDRAADGAPISATQWRIVNNSLQPSLKYDYWWQNGKLVRSAISTAQGDGTVHTTYSRDASGALLSKVDSGEGYLAKTEWKRDAAGHVVEALATSRYEYASTNSTSMVRHTYSYDPDGNFRRMDIANRSSDTGAWQDVVRELYTYDAQGRLTNLSSAFLCADFDAAGCKYSTTRISWLGSSWRVGVRPSNGLRSSGWRSYVHDGSFVIDAPASRRVSLEIVRLDGTRVVATSGKGRLTTEDLRRWRGSPLLWRARIGNETASGGISLP